MNRILMQFDYMESVGDVEKQQRDRLFLIVFKGLKYNITYKTITNKIRHRLDEPQTLDTLVELYDEIPNFIKELNVKK
jgi:hypothetical protein